MHPISLGEPAAGHAAPITHVAFSPDGAWLASSSYDGSVVLWRHQSHPAAGHQSPLVPVTRIRHRRLVNASSWSPHHPGLLATAAADQTVGLWRLHEEGSVEAVGRLARHTDDVNAVAWLDDGERLVSVSEDSTSLLWEARTGRYLGRVTAHAGHCMGVAVSTAGVVLTVGEDGEVFAGDVDQPSRAKRRHFPTSIEGCAWSPDGTRAVLACDDGRLRVVSPELDLLDELEVTASAARAVAFATDGSERLVVGSYDASVQVLNSRRRIEAIQAGGRLWPRSLDTHGATVVVGSFGSSPVVLDLDELTPRTDGGPATHGPNALGAAGGRIAVGLDSGRVVVTDRQLRPLGSYEVSDDPVLSVAPAPNGWLAGTYGGWLHRLEDGREGRWQMGIGAPLPSLAAIPGGAIAGTYGGDIIHVSFDGGISVKSRVYRHEGSVKSLGWNPAGFAVSGATDASVRRIEVEGGQDDLLWVHGNLVNAVATDSRGLVASASRDRLVRVGHGLGPAGGGGSAALLGADESMKAVALLGTGRQVVVLGGSYDFATYAWDFDIDSVPDARAGTVVFEADQAISTMIALDEVTAVVASWDGTVRLVSLESGRLVVGAAARIEDLVAGAVVVGRERVGA